MKLASQGLRPQKTKRIWIIAENNLGFKIPFMILTHFAQQDNLPILTPLDEHSSKKLTLGYKDKTAWSHDFTPPPLS